MSEEILCPIDGSRLDLKVLNKSIIYKGKDIEYEIESYVCPQCGFEENTIEQAGKAQEMIENKYKGLLRELMDNIRKNG